MGKIRISGFGKALPSNIVTNSQLSEMVETTDEWIVQRTGIRERRISDETTTELAVRAARAALKNAGKVPEDIDLIICATTTPDNFVPSVACMVQNHLGINDKSVTAFDVNAACTGFIYAAKAAYSLLKTQEHRCALVIGAETLSRIIDFNDNNTCVLFGDGAGAIIMEKDADYSEEIFFYTNSMGNDQFLCAKSAAMNTHMDNRQLIGEFLKMEGSEVFKFALKALGNSIEEILKISGDDIDDIKLIIPHQANYRIIYRVGRQMGIDREKFYINLQKYGNTAAASTAIALCEAVEEGRLEKGDKVIAAAFGGGMTWGAAIFQI